MSKLIVANIIGTVIVAAFIIFMLHVINTPCAMEDSPNCFWDASSAGNGVGNSFIDVGGHAFYLAP